MAYKDSLHLLLLHLLLLDPSRPSSAFCVLKIADAGFAKRNQLLFTSQYFRVPTQIIKTKNLDASSKRWQEVGRCRGEAGGE